MASKTVITVMIRFRVLLPISVPFECVFVDKRPILLSATVLWPAMSKKIPKSRNATLQKQWSYVHVSA